MQKLQISLNLLHAGDCKKLACLDDDCGASAFELTPE